MNCISATKFFDSRASAEIMMPLSRRIQFLISPVGPARNGIFAIVAPFLSSGR